MKKTLLALTLILSSFLAKAQCDGTRFFNYVFSNVDLTSNVQYGTNTKYDGTSQNLLMDIYEPIGDNEAMRPLIIVAHGGFFLSGSKTGADVVPICQAFAKMGYVAVSLEYRLGINIQSDLSAPMTEAVMRGVQDGKAAVRYFRKSAAEDGNPYRINPDQIFFAGSSAGGYIALHMAYLDTDAEIPTYVNLSNPGLDGGLEGNSGNAGYSSSVNAIVNICGAIGDTAWIQPGDEPCLLFHGTNDQTVPFGSAMQYAFGVAPVVEVDGSNSINEKLNQVGVEHCFEIYEGQDHVPHMTNTFYLDTTLSIMSNFIGHYVCNQPLDCSYRTLSVGVNELLAHEALTLFPNPAVTYFQINAAQVQRILIYNVQGQLVEQSLNENRVDISTLPDGMYFVKVESNQLVKVLPLVIKH